MEHQLTVCRLNGYTPDEPPTQNPKDIDGILPRPIDLGAEKEIIHRWLAGDREASCNGFRLQTDQKLVFRLAEDFFNFTSAQRAVEFCSEKP
jgi:hypothetical protein